MRQTLFILLLVLLMTATASAQKDFSYTTVQPQNGAVGGTGPEGTFDFGQAMEVYTPEAAAYYAAPYGARPPLVAAYGDPGRELQELWAQFKLVNAPDDIHIIERASLPWWTSGPGEILHLQAFINGSQSEWIAEVLTSQSGAGKWMYYYSGVSTARQISTRICQH
jgi:hypothetical protein